MNDNDPLTSKVQDDPLTSKVQDDPLIMKHANSIPAPMFVQLRPGLRVKFWNGDVSSTGIIGLQIPLLTGDDKPSLSTASLSTASLSTTSFAAAAAAV